MHEYSAACASSEDRCCVRGNQTPNGDKRRKCAHFVIYPKLLDLTIRCMFRMERPAVIALDRGSRIGSSDTSEECFEAKTCL